MLSFAVSAVEKLHRVPRQNLINLGLGLLVLVVVIALIKVAARMNKFVLFAIIFVLVLVVGFTWIYERNEPKFLTPLIDSLAPYFPQRPHY
jgi:MFS superfamily sulfate permease-like transporter